MIESIEFLNFKALRKATLPLGQFTLIVGPNGAGKSTALQALNAVRPGGHCTNSGFERFRSAGVDPGLAVEIRLRWGGPRAGIVTRGQWARDPRYRLEHSHSGKRAISQPEAQAMNGELQRLRVYALEARALEVPVSLQPNMELGDRGEGLAGVLDRLRDKDPERFELLNHELHRLLPEFDRITFDTPEAGKRGVCFRTSKGHHSIRAEDVSQGSLLALAILTLAYLPEPPPLIGLEEPDRGIHPRLLRDIRDALYRLAYPESFSETRPPVQVVVTTQSPYFLDLFKDHPEEIVIAQKEGLEARFERLVDHPNIEEIIDGAPLGEVWYSGVLGGVP